MQPKVCQLNVNHNTLLLLSILEINSYHRNKVLYSVFAYTVIRWLAQHICSCIYHILLIIRGEKVSYFLQITLQPRRLLVILCDNVFKHGIIQILRKCSFGNEGKDVKQQNFFTTNNKQCTVVTYIHGYLTISMW